MNTLMTLADITCCYYKQTRMQAPTKECPKLKIKTALRKERLYRFIIRIIKKPNRKPAL